MTKDTFHELLIKLKNGKESQLFDIIVNDVILKEWERNKSNTIKSLTESIKNDYKAVKNLSRFLSEGEKKSFYESLSFCEDENKRIDEAKRRVQDVESFMQSCTIINVTSEQKLFVADLAINKQAPFQNNKNHFNDSLIIRNIVEYAKKEIPFQYDVIYVSNNPNDFIDKSSNNIHSELLEGLEHIKIESVTDLGKALKLAPELIDDFDAWLDQALDDQAMHQLDIMRGK